MDGFGARLKRDLSSSWCKLFPKTVGCDSSNDNNGNNGNGPGSRGSNDKPTTSAKATTKAVAAPTTPSKPTTSTSVKQSTPSTTSVRYVAASTATPQAAAPASTPAALSVGQDSTTIVAPPASTTAQQQQPATAENTTAPQAAASTPTVTAGNASPSVSPVATPSLADKAGTAPTQTIVLSVTDQASADRGIVSTTSQGIYAATETGVQKHPTTSAVPVSSGDGGKSNEDGGGTTNKTPAIVGAVVGVVLLAIIAAIIYRYRRSRAVRPLLLPFSCAKRRKHHGDDSTPPPGSQITQDAMREKTSRENLLGSRVVAGALPSPTHSAAPPYFPPPTRSTEQWLSESHSPPTTLPQTTFQPKRALRDGRRRVTIPREQRLVPLGDHLAGDSSPEAGFPIPPSEPGSQRNSVSSSSSSGRPYSTFSAGNESVASSGVLCPVVMAWPVPPTSSKPRTTGVQPRSPLASNFGGNGAFDTTGGPAERDNGTWSRHVAMYHDDDRN